ncbi:MAG: phosphotransferase [Actinomycetota bacterium]|nr:phosphotransferase [Actinomycetota bacterium]
MTLEELLTGWLPGQRWYAGKGTAIRGVVVEASTPLLEQPDIRHLVARVDREDGGSDRYQLLLGLLDGEVPVRLDHAVIGDHDGRTAYDATHAAEATGALLDLLAGGGERDGLRFTAAVDLDVGLPCRVLGAEQSNTCLVYGDDYILKLFRRLQPGPNPDLEVTRALARAGSLHVPPPLAWAEGDVAGEPTTLAMMQPFLRNASDGWAMATASVRDLFAERDLHAEEVGGDFAGEADRLGAATADVHRMMAAELPSRLAGPDESRATGSQLHERLAAAVAVVPDLAPYASELRAAYDQVGGRSTPVPVQRVHGDLHLGQVLRTQDRWIVLDFEGEPARSLAERTALLSPLRDVAGMLRSFDYAARHLLAERGEEPQLAYRAAEWAQRNREAFCDGYARGSGVDPRDEPELLRAFELDKAVYEVVYEARNRPSWLPIPLASIARLVGDSEQAGHGG